MKTIVVVDKKDNVLCMAYENEQTNDITIVEPADGSIKMEVFNFEPRFIEIGDGNIKLSRTQFTVNKDDLE